METVISTPGHSRGLTWAGELRDSWKLLSKPCGRQDLWGNLLSAFFGERLGA